MNSFLKAPALTVMPFSLSFHECFLYRLLPSLRGGSWLAFHIQTPPASDSFFTLDPFQECFPEPHLYSMSTCCAPDKHYRQKSLLRGNSCANSHLYAPALGNFFCTGIYLSAPDKLFHSTAAPGHSVLMQICSTFPVSDRECMHSLLTLWDEKIRL